MRFTEEEKVNVIRFVSRIAGLVWPSFGKRPRLGAAVVLTVVVPVLPWGQSTSWTFSGTTASVTGVNVGIGTTNPGNRLAVVGGGNANVDIAVTGRILTGDALGYGGVWLDSANTTFIGYNNTASTAGTIGIWTSGMGFTFNVARNGNVGIGTFYPQYPLSVNGIIQAKEVLVNTGWSDYVFDPKYRLKPLQEVASYIQANHHLPDIPSAKEVETKGINLGEMQSKLLAKVEELTLHMIEAERENRELRERIARLEAARH